jgi:putative ABC transport system ATP-binding protein
MENSAPILAVSDVSKRFVTPEGPVSILEHLSFSVKRGEKVAIIGPSGSGKSTLLSLIGLLDMPSEGRILIEGKDVSTLSESEQARVRNEKIGFVFQSFELIAPFTAFENIVAPLDVGGVPVAGSLAEELLHDIGLAERRDAMPFTLSGGEKQRIAIARALVREPAILLADEPTGSLDRVTGEHVLSMLLDVVNKKRTTLLLITHDESIAARMDRVFVIRDRTLYERT